jgi:hypothetical protein
VDMKRQTVTRSQWDNKKGYNLLILVGWRLRGCARNASGQFHKQISNGFVLKPVEMQQNAVLIPTALYPKYCKMLWSCRMRTLAKWSEQIFNWLNKLELIWKRKKVRSTSLLLLIKVKGKRSNNWFGAADSHITLALGISHITGPYEMGGVLANR